jgi:hypothetical protein
LRNQQPAMDPVTRNPSSEECHVRLWDEVFDDGQPWLTLSITASHPDSGCFRALGLNILC